MATLVAVVCPSLARAGSQFPFPRPASLEPNISFWVDVFTAYSYRDFVVHDRDNVWKIYQVLHLPGSGPPTGEEVEWANVYLKTKYGDIFTRLANGREPIGSDERRVAELFRGEPPGHYAAAAQNLRVQQGLRERFREALLRRRNYESAMERTFRAAGLPVELVVLAGVESGYYNRARSGAGAVGMWQFTRSTGRHYLKIGRRYDERLNPYRATAAAAKLLRYNYEVLGTWPLAITAYNYGTSGMARAVEAYGSDFIRILQNYSAPHFGFASRNYYSEFLAALQVHRFEREYFPGIETEATPPPQPVVTRVTYRPTKRSNHNHVNRATSRTRRKNAHSDPGKAGRPKSRTASAA